MRKCEECGNTEWKVFYDDVELKYRGQMTSIVKNPEDVGDYDWEYTEFEVDPSDNYPEEINAEYSGIMVACAKCGWEAEPDTEQALEEWLTEEENG